MSLLKSQTLYVFLFTNILSACYQRPQAQRTEVESAPEFPKIIDTSERSVFICYEIGCHFPVLYVGILKDTLQIDYYNRFIWGPDPHPFPPGTKVPEHFNPFESYYQRELPSRYKKWKETKLWLNVDTSQVFLHDTDESLIDDMYRGIPICIYNRDSDTAFLASGKDVYLIVEAKDSYGIWRPIRKRCPVFCGSGMKYLLVPPNQILLTSVMMYNKRVKTAFRIRIGKNYSDSFQGFVRPDEFIHDWTWSDTTYY